MLSSLSSVVVLVGVLLGGASQTPLGVVPVTMVATGYVTQYINQSEQVKHGIQETFLGNTSEYLGTYTPTTHLNIRNHPWGEVQTVLSPGDELEASREVYQDEVDWVEVTYTTGGKTVTGWTSKAYIQDYEDYIYEKENPSYVPNTIYYNGTSRPYKNNGYSGGQYTIDTSDYASTWGGAQTFSGYDGLSTHLIGHSHMQFQGLTDAYTFIVTDGSGNAFQYNRTALYLVDEYGVDVNSGQNLYDLVTGTWGGERLVLQTTEVHPRKWIITADYVGQVN